MFKSNGRLAAGFGLAAALATAGTASASVVGFGTSGGLNLPAGKTGQAAYQTSTFQLNSGDCCGAPFIQVNAAGDTLAVGGGGYAWGSAFTLNKQGVSSFTAQFTLQVTGSPNYPAEFYIQNDARGSAALPKDNTGYSGDGANITPAAALFFAPKANASAGGVGLDTSGAFVSASGTQPGSVNMLADPVNVTLSYDGANLTETLLDQTTSATFTKTYAVDLPTLLGGSTAFIGFSRGADGSAGTYTFSNFSYTDGASLPEPTVTALLGGAAALAVRRRRHRVA